MPKNTELPPEHIGNIPAGHKRDEEVKRRQDELDMRGEQEAAAVGIESIDEMPEVTNEVARHIMRDGQIHITGMQKGYRYVFLTHAQEYQGSARSNVRSMHATAQMAGYQYVQGNDPEARELKGNDCASGTTLRGWGDTVLARIREEDAQRAEEKDLRKRRAMEQVEENIVALAVRNYGPQMRGLVEGAAGNFSPNSRLGRFFPGQASQPEHIVVKSTFDEGDLRRGSIPGMPAPGGRI